MALAKGHSWKFKGKNSKKTLINDRIKRIASFSGFLKKSNISNNFNTRFFNGK